MLKMKIAGLDSFTKNLVALQKKAEQVAATKSV